MASLLREWIDEVAGQVAAFATYGPEIQGRLHSKLKKSVLVLESVVADLASGKRIADSASERILRESLTRFLGGGTSIDLAIALSPVDYRGLRSAVWLNEGAAAFVLLLSPSVDFTRNPLLPRTVHEAAHAEASAHALVTHMDIFERWSGEALCDLLAAMIAGPAFYFSTTAVVELLGKERSRDSDFGHPSMATRAQLLRAVGPLLWPESPVAGIAIQALPDRTLVCKPNELRYEENLERRTTAQVATYQGLSTDKVVWEGAYLGGQEDAQGSALVALNMDFAANATRGRGT